MAPRKGIAALACQARVYRSAGGLLMLVSAHPSGDLEETMYGTSEEAKAMLNKAVAAVKEDKTKALDMFNAGEGGL
jgi:hypothetical protein